VLERVIVAGFGGQGVLFLGKLLSGAIMHEGKSVTYFPAYGPEVRGGKANCHVTIASGEIFSPVITEADALIIMNQPSWDFFLPLLQPEGLAVLNSSMAAPGAGQAVHGLLAVPATEIANGLGDVRATNMVMLGAYNHVRELLSVDTLLGHLRAALSGPKARLFDVNQQALLKGIEAAREAHEKLH